jgi:hypothetical protein
MKLGKMANEANGDRFLAMGAPTQVKTWLALKIRCQGYFTIGNYRSSAEKAASIFLGKSYAIPDKYVHE